MSLCPGSSQGCQRTAISALGWHPSALLTERAFWITLQIVVRKWEGYCLPSFVGCCGKASWDYTRPHYEMFKGGTKGIEWINQHALQRNKHGNRGIEIKGGQ